MNTMPINVAKKNLEAVIHRVVTDAEPTILCTSSGESAVLMSLADFNAWQETNYLLRNPANAAHLRQSLAEAESGQSAVSKQFFVP